MNKNGIRDRLENWAKWSRGRGRTGSASLTSTGMVCDRLRKVTIGTLSSHSSWDVDEKDAALIERAWSKLIPKHSKLLQLMYVQNANPFMVCRRLGIRPRPTTIFDAELQGAERAIEQILRGMVE